MKSPRKEKPENSDMAQLREHLSKLLLEPPSPADLVALRGDPVPQSLLPPPSALAVDRLCFEIERRGFAHGIFRVAGGGFKTRALVAALSHLRTGDEVVFKSEPNVHNVAAALSLYLSRTQPLISFDRYESLFECVRQETPALSLAPLLSRLPRRKVLQRVMKMCCDCARQSEANQMSAKNLAIVFAPVLFHDEAEPTHRLPLSQGPKMLVIEAMISHYSLAFPAPLDPVYRPPPQPGEVPLLTERDWALLTAKAERVTLSSGETLLEQGQKVAHLYRVQRGSMMRETSSSAIPGSGDSGSRRLISGDFFGERALLGRHKSEAKYVASEDETELWAMSPSHLAAIWEADARISAAFWGHVAISYSVDLRGQAAAMMAGRMTVGAGARFSTVLHEEEMRAGNNNDDEEDNDDARSAVTTTKKKNAGDAVIVERECMLKRCEGRVMVTALEVRFVGEVRGFVGARGIVGTSKTVSIPYESFERISTSVSDDVVRGKRHASKKYSKRAPFHTITLTMRKRKNRSVKQVQKVLNFFCENDAAEVFACAAKLFNTVSEEQQKKFRAAHHHQHQEEVAEEEEEGGSTRIVAKAVALFDFSDGAGLSFRPGDIVMLTTEKKDLRVRGRLASSSSSFGLFPRDYVEPVVWVSSVRGLPSEADLQSIFSCGTRRTVEAEGVVVREGEPMEALFLVESGVCRTLSAKPAPMVLGKMAKGDIFGEISFLLGGAATCSVFAHGMQTTVVEVRREVLRALFAVRPDLASKFYRLFAAVNMRRLERNAAAPFSDRRAKFATSSKGSSANLPVSSAADARKSIMMNALNI